MGCGHLANRRDVDGPIVGIIGVNAKGEDVVKVKSEYREVSRMPRRVKVLTLQDRMSVLFHNFCLVL